MIKKLLEPKKTEKSKIDPLEVKKALFLDQIGLALERDFLTELRPKQGTMPTDKDKCIKYQEMLLFVQGLRQKATDEASDAKELSGLFKMISYIETKLPTMVRE